MTQDKQNNRPNVPPLRFPEFTEPWETAKLGAIAEFSKGTGISKEQRSETGLPCILYGELYTTYTNEVIEDVVSKTDLDPTDLVKSQKNDVIIPSSGETAEDIATARCVTSDNVLLGGDLNIIRLVEPNDGRFMSYQLNGIRKYDIAKIAQGVSVVHLYGGDLKMLSVTFPQSPEQKKIADCISLLDRRISVQSGLIEDLQKLKAAIIERLYSQQNANNKIGEMVTQVSTRNRGYNDYSVLSVNNRLGFIEQSEQFEDRMVASEDTSNYKVVSRDDFAYNPARINVGSIARLTSFEKGIVSPMYICFHTKKLLLPQYLEHFFATRYFDYEMQKRLEGSVGLCLSWEGLCNIPISVPSIEQQEYIANRITRFADKISLEERYLDILKIQKQYLHQAMFI